MRLTTAQTDRACGVLLAAACGDALGAGYEFDHVTPDPEGPRMIGGGLGDFAPGEWTDDTSMLFAIAEVAATGADLRTTEALDAIARRFREWYDGHPADIGVQTSHVLGAVGPQPTAERMTEAAAELHRRRGRSGGNGSLMRTAPVALAHLDDPVALVEAAMRVSALTHHDPGAGEACALWCLGIRHAVLTGELPDLRDLVKTLVEVRGAPATSVETESFWVERIDEAEQRDPATFTANGYVVTALQAAWSAIAHTTVPGDAPWRHLVGALGAAVAIGNDTDTVAAIAGAMLGARWGASAVPAEWRRIVHGWPGKRAEDLVHLAHLAATKGPGIYGWPLAERIDYADWNPTPVAVRHPYDDRVVLGNAAALNNLDDLGVTAVVSLCLLGTQDVPADVEHVSFRLIDKSDERSNAHLDYVVDDAARTVKALRDEGHTVLLHCVAAQSRTPTVAIRYAHLLGVPADEAFDKVCNTLPSAHPNPAFRAALARLGGA